MFDGADDPLTGVPVVASGAGLRARPVKVSFTPPRVEADDVILDAVDALPPSQAVVVVSSDRRVRDGALAGGANVVSTAQFVASWGSAGFLSYPPR